MQQYTRFAYGFTLIEVLVSILISTVFVAVALQGVVVTTILRTRTLQQSEVANWVQNDVEAIRWQATVEQLPVDSSRCQVSSGDQGFADALRDRLAQTDVTGTNSYTLPAQIEHSVTGQAFELSRTLLTTNEPTARHILGIQYTVKPAASSSTPILSSYVEVLPDAALQCP